MRCKKSCKSHLKIYTSKQQHPAEPVTKSRARLKKHPNEIQLNTRARTKPSWSRIPLLYIYIYTYIERPSSKKEHCRALRASFQRVIYTGARWHSPGDTFFRLSQKRIRRVLGCSHSHSSLHAHTHAQTHVRVPDEPSSLSSENRHCAAACLFFHARSLFLQRTKSRRTRKNYIAGAWSAAVEYSVLLDVSFWLYVHIEVYIRSKEREKKKSKERYSLTRVT